MADQYNQNLTFVGLGTLSITVPLASPYYIEGKISLPTLSKGDSAPSAVVVEVTVDSVSVYTGDAGAEGFRVTFSADVGDVVAVILSSSAAVDQGLNVIKSVISIGQGQ